MLVKYTGNKSRLKLTRPEFNGQYLFTGQTPTEMSRADGELAVKLFPEVFKAVPAAIVIDDAPETRESFCKRVFGKHISKVTKREIEQYSGGQLDLRRSKTSLIDSVMGA